MVFLTLKQAHCLDNVLLMEVDINIFEKRKIQENSLQKYANVSCVFTEIRLVYHSYVLWYH